MGVITICPEHQLLYDFEKKRGGGTCRSLKQRHGAFFQLAATGSKFLASFGLYYFSALSHRIKYWAFSELVYGTKILKNIPRDSRSMIWLHVNQWALGRLFAHCRLISFTWQNWILWFIYNFSMATTCLDVHVRSLIPKCSLFLDPSLH